MIKEIHYIYSPESIEEDRLAVIYEITNNAVSFCWIYDGCWCAWPWDLGDTKLDEELSFVTNKSDNLKELLLLEGSTDVWDEETESYKVYD